MNKNVWIPITPDQSEGIYVRSTKAACEWLDKIEKTMTPPTMSDWATLLVGWKGFYDINGKEIPFLPVNLARLLETHPQVFLDMIPHIVTAVDYRPETGEEVYH